MQNYIPTHNTVIAFEINIYKLQITKKWEATNVTWVKNIRLENLKLKQWV